MEGVLELLEHKPFSGLRMPSFIVLSLYELFEMIQNSSSKVSSEGFHVENGVISNCSYKSRTGEYIEYILWWYYIICLIVFSLLVKRVSYKRNQCNGRPGLALPMNMLNSHDFIVEYTFIFLSLSEEIFRYIFGMKDEFGPMIPIVKFFVKLLIVLMFSVISCPIFIANCGRNLVPYIMIMISSTGYFSMGVLSASSYYKCLLGTKIVPHIVIAMVYCFFDISIVCIFIRKIVKHIQYNGWMIKDSKPPGNKRDTYCQVYVKELLNDKSSMITQKDEKLNEVENGLRIIKTTFQCSELREKMKNKVYRSIPGFSIPPRLMIGIFVGLYFSYRILMFAIFDMTPSAWNLINNLNMKYPTTENNLQNSFKIVSSNFSHYPQIRILNSFRYLVFFYSHLLIVCVIIAVIIGFVNSIIQSFLLLRNYRLHFHNITKKGFSYLIDIKRAPEPNNLILGFVRYSGYQAAYTLWGIIVVSIFTFLLLYILIGIFLLPLFFVEDSWARNLVINYGPVIIASFIFNLSQSLIVKYVFVKERGALMEVNNRRAFMIYTHCAFCLNAMMGIFNSIKRIIIWIFSGVFCFSRIDFSSLPKYLHGLDNGFMCYIGFLYTEQYHFNPILICFTQILLESTGKDTVQNILSSYKSDNNKERLKYRNKWHVAFTLINNHKLLAERKRFWETMPILNDI